jgi:hypothetical protein
MYEFVTAEKELPMEEIYPMPPDDRPRLSSEEIETIKEWIVKGAAWPEGLILGRSKYQGDRLHETSAFACSVLVYCYRAVVGCFTHEFRCVRGRDTPRQAHGQHQ